LTRHAFPTAVPKLFHVAHWWLAKELFILAVEVRGIIIAYSVARACRIQALPEHQAAGFLQPQLLLELQRAHCGQRPEVMVEARNAHPELARDLLDPQLLVEVSPEPVEGRGDAVGAPAQGRHLRDPAALLARSSR